MQRPAESEELLGVTGPIAAGLETYEERREQLEMASAVQEALFSSHNLVVEAGTGVGKSFAYLVPAVLAARRARMRVVVSTHTISLQEQLVGKDIPFLEEHLGMDFKAVLAKGRGNYLCIRRLYRASNRETSLFEDSEAVKELGRIIDWAYETEDGSRTDLEPLPRGDVWEKVCSERGVCNGRRCKYHKKCFYQRSRRRLWDAEIIVANHSLFFSDLVLHAKKGGFLPPYEGVILDEAHSVEGVASEHFGLDVSNYSVSYLLNSLYNGRTGKGFLTVIPDNALRKRVEDLRRYSEGFFDEVSDWLETRAPSNGRVEAPMGVVNSLSEPLKEFARQLRRARAAAETEDDEMELSGYAGRCLDVAFGVEAFINRQGEDLAFWVMRGGRGGKRIALKAAPVSVAPYMRDFLYDEAESVVFTSATLAVGGDDRFEYLRGRLGIDEARTLRLGSPFDYYRQVKLVIPRGMPEPTEDGYAEAVGREVLRYVKATGGKAFVLFTSYRLLDGVYLMTAGELRSAGIECYRQGERLGRTLMLAKFKGSGAACIFGTASFWQGVDVPGEALSNVIITRLPFPVPDMPLVAARQERIRDAGGDAFKEYSLPEAVLRFKQGFGRLIRRKSDTGIVVVLDTRITKRWYGRAFLASIPQCEMVESLDVEPL